MSAEHVLETSRTKAASPAQMVGQLLAEARQLLIHDPAAAHRHIAEATALLQGTSGANPIFQRGGLAPWQVRRLRDHVASHLSGRLATTELAELVGLSASYFNAAFRVSFGCSPHVYVIRQRVRGAQALMTTTNLPLSQIALMCGFSDQPHFCRLFRRATGMTPADWRRRRGEALSAMELAEA